MLRRTVRAAAWATGVGAAIALLCAVWIALPLPAAMREPRVVPSLTITDRNGLPLRTTRSPDGERGGWISISEVDPDVIRAFVAAEDRRFYEHHGVDPRALGRALRDNVQSGRVVSGASTITMQTARLLRGTSRSWSGKFVQTMWALRLDAHLSKNQILEQYLNLVPLGQGTVGVPAAAQLYFNSTASELSLGQAALLAGIARVPARDNPIRSSARAQQQRAAVLAAMRTQGFIAADEGNRASSEPALNPAAANLFLAPHFTTQLLAHSGEVATGTIRASIDLDLQRALEAEVRHTVNTLQDRAVRHAAAVVLDNRTGDVLAWVGSPNFFADTAGQVDMVISARQPGSALKPFLYGLAFDRGFTAASVLPDIPRSYPTSTGPYEPQNYDRTFRGPVRAREALASSYNVPAVELAERVSAGALLSTLHDAGFASLKRTAEHYGLGLALGNGDVTLIELANAYRGIANGGVWRPHRMAVDAQKSSHEVRFMSSHAAALILEILTDPIARIPGFGAATPLDFPFPAAAKTGTSRHFTDNWAVATTANFTVAVWVGNFSGRPMQGVSGITGAGPLLHRAVLETAQRYAPGYLVRPDEAGLVASNVCILSGMRATPGCPAMLEWFTPGTEPIAHDDWQRDGRTVLPPEFAEWAAQKNTRLTFAGNTSDADGQHAAERILSPLDGDRYQRPVGVDARYATIPLVAGAADDVRWTVDGRALTAPRWQLTTGTHVITATWPSGAKDSVRVVVE